jgi:hypothetical protein
VGLAGVRFPAAFAVNGMYARFATTSREFGLLRKMGALASPVVCVALVAALASAGPAAVAAPSSLPPDRVPCAWVNRPGDGLVSQAVPVTAPGAPGCVLASADVTTTAAGQAIFLRGRATVNDTERAVNTANRDYIIATLRCFDGQGTARFGLGSITNVWEGIPNAGLYPTGVFVAPSAGTWTCDVEAGNGAVLGNGETYYVTVSTLTTAVHAGGAESPNPADQFVPPGTTYANGNKFQVARISGSAPGASVTATANTNLTTCSFNSDVTAGCPSSGIPNSLTANVAIHLWIWQTISGTNFGQCSANPPVESSWSGTISSVMHHYTVGQYTTLPMVGTCGPDVVVKTEIENFSGGPYVHIESGSTTVGYVY